MRVIFQSALVFYGNTLILMKSEGLCVVIHDARRWLKTFALFVVIRAKYADTICPYLLVLNGSFGFFIGEIESKISSLISLNNVG